MLKLSRNNPNIKIFGVPLNTLPLVIYIGIFCYWVLLHYNMSFKTIAGGFNGAFWWYGPLSEDQEKFEQIYQNYLVALTMITKTMSSNWKECLHKIVSSTTCSSKHWVRVSLISESLNCSNNNKHERQTPLTIGILTEDNSTWIEPEFTTRSQLTSRMLIMLSTH